MGAGKERSWRNSGQGTAWRQSAALQDGAMAPWRVSQARRKSLRDTALWMPQAQAGLRRQ
jgi:hypothetical protein